MLLIIFFTSLIVIFLLFISYKIICKITKEKYKSKFKIPPSYTLLEYSPHETVQTKISKNFPQKFFITDKFSSDNKLNFKFHSSTMNWI